MVAALLVGVTLALSVSPPVSAGDGPQDSSESSDVQQAPDAGHEVLPAPLQQLDATVLEKLQAGSVPSQDSDGSYTLKQDIPTGDGGTRSVSVTAPNEASNKILLTLDDSKTVLVELNGADAGVQAISDWGLFYGGSSPQVVTFPTDAAIETFTLLTSAKAPATLMTEVVMSADLELKQVDDNAVAIVGADQYPLLFVDAPWAVDASGIEVPLTIGVQDNYIVMNVDHQSGSYDYPLVVDPVWYYFGYGY